MRKRIVKAEERKIIKINNKGTRGKIRDGGKGGKGKGEVTRYDIGGWSLLSTDH